jgi:hypothetical protein
LVVGFNWLRSIESSLSLQCLRLGRGPLESFLA